MAAPAKQSSRWGSFLQQAVAGVESRLDNILAEENEATHTPAKKAPPAPTTPTKPEGSISRAASGSNRTNDRLQERLARAVAAKNTAQKTEKADSLALSSGPPSRTGSPATVAESPRQSIDVERTKLESPPNPATPPNESTASDAAPSIEVQPPKSNEQEPDSKSAPNGLTQSVDHEASPRPSMDSVRPSLPRNSTDSLRSPASNPRASTELQPSGTNQAKTSEEYEALLKQLQSDYETSELQRQEEVHTYIERIDALQSKLQYLAKEGAEAARKASGAAQSGSLEKKLADKDEQIALLMEEGQKLSKKELNQLTTIKKLRAKAQEDSKELLEAKKKQEKAETELSTVTDRWRRAQGSEKLLNDKQKQIAQLQKDVESLRSENITKDSIIADLKRQVEEAATQEREAEAKAVNEALEFEKSRVAELEEDLANLRIEKNLAVERGQNQMKAMTEKMEKDLERARMTELEMKTEQQMLESKLEVMRARAEEVSSGTTGDAQAKLLRQIETLQSQYAVASENWQGIEASLIARATSLEKERDEATKRESDIRKKAREVTLKAKRHEDELEETRSQLPSFEQQLNEHRTKLESLQRRAEEAESSLAAAQASFAQEKEAWQIELLQRIEEERSKWQEESGSIREHGRADSPVTSMRRGLTTEFLGLQNLQLRRASSRSVISDTPTQERFVGHRSSPQPLSKISGNATPVRQDSGRSFKENFDVSHTPSITTDRDDDFFDGPHASPTSQDQTINDMVSVSAAGAGPSVQLVERMSSAVRRLESEKVTSKEDLSRLAAQRDEARAEIVALMKEVTVKREKEKRIEELEEELKGVNERYLTTLEMLGEKSEMVEELKSDIVDIKGMYRELVERTVK
ncbi:hypothetical protein HYFRA_00003410 [Hymenoscyphus fraxineus]|uniref:TATA element modulatory factor 1 TATA binding domain-containing protein n=1 Tax=Hymenoscyphus fraxineus TaxID=746836 RepID=A0A9N9KUN7_9HELO|nr:hypothetical protein HYFRA_00003410 [Hymenoscyphus fraxineus]